MEHVPQAELQNRIELAKNEVAIGGRYCHYKDSSKTYVIKDIAILEVSEQPCVIYQAEYGEMITFVRPLEEWIEEVAWQDQTVPRFTRVS